MSDQETVLGGVDLNNYVEPEILDAGTQTDFTVLDAEIKKSESGYTWYALTLKPLTDEVPNPAIINQNLFAPKEGDEASKQNAALGRIKKFCESIGYEPEDGKPDVTEFLGKQGACIVSVKQDEGYDPKNQVRRFLPQE